MDAPKRLKQPETTGIERLIQCYLSRSGLARPRAPEPCRSMHSYPPRESAEGKREMRGQGSGPARLCERGERRVSEARVIIGLGSGRSRFEFGSIESPYKGLNPFSGNPFLPVRDKAIDSGRRRALRAREGGSKIQKPKTFWREDFLEGNTNTNTSCVCPAHPCAHRVLRWRV